MERGDKVIKDKKIAILGALFFTAIAGAIGGTTLNALNAIAADTTSNTTPTNLFLYLEGKLK